MELRLGVVLMEAARLETEGQKGGTLNPGAAAVLRQRPRA